MAAQPGTSLSKVGTRPLYSPMTPPSDLITCLITSIGPLYCKLPCAQAALVSVKNYDKL